MSIDEISERAHWVAWSRLPGLQGCQLTLLAREFGSLAAAWRAPAWAIVACLDTRGSAKAAAARATCDPLEVWQAVQRPGQQVLLAGDALFPAQLLTIPDPPGVLYLRGTLPAWSHVVAIVGTRAASAYGARTARKLAGQLAELDVVVVSGAAAGIDGQAHEGALAAGGRTVAVLGCGLDHVYPASHGRLYGAIARQGALLTEHPPDEGPTRYSFPRRNRLIAGLSSGVLVVEADEQSGSLITVDFALEQGRGVLAVPGPIDAKGSRGPHALLRDGARLVTGVEDVLDELGWALVPVPKPEATDPLELALLQQLAAGPRALEALAAACPAEPGRLSTALLKLELAGRVLRQPGPRYARL